MPEVLADPQELPRGGHLLSFHATPEEGSRHAARFLAGTPPGQAASYWVVDEPTRRSYREASVQQAPDHVGCIAILPHCQAAPSDGVLRPAKEVQDFLRDHPEGVTAAGETITHYWTPETIPQHLEYEAWFQDQDRERSRFMCPYDLREIPRDLAPRVLRELGAHHTHVVLADSQEPGVRLLELFVFPKVRDIPSVLDGALGWALKRDLVEVDPSSNELSLTPAGDAVIREWSDRTVVA